MKKRLLPFLALFFAMLLLLSALFRQTERALIATVSVSAEAAAPVIILDAGHGGADSGAVGVNGVLEKELNLSLSKDLAALLRLAGYTVIETRTEDRLLCEEEAQKGHRKQADLSGRLAFTEQYPEGVLISIHMNTFPAADCKGVQVWYSQNHADSKEWATAVQNRVKRELQPHNDRKVKAATSNIYLLRHAEIPAILIECGFLSTPAECERLCDPLYRRQLALVFFAAIAEKSPLPSCKQGASVL